MSKISNEDIIDIRSKANIVDIIGEYLPLIQRGKNFFALCPFHDDNNPSMSISPEKQIYTCFVCGASGNVFTFLMEYENLSFLETVKLIADKVGVKIDINNNPKQTKNHVYDKYYNIYDLVNKYYQNNLYTNNGKNAKEYLYNRSFTDEIIKEFAIGLSSNDNKVYQMLKKNQYSDEELLEIGICTANDKGTSDTFRNRIMFPLWDLQGQVVAFSGRVYTEQNISKYINSKESKIFKKGKLLYNYHRAKDEIRRKKSVIVVEGFVDVIALYKVGLKNVVATMGTAITAEQVVLIKKLSSNVTLCFDGDNAGEKATITATGELIKAGIIPKIIRLSDNQDPDDYIKEKGEKAFLNLIDTPMSFLDFKIAVHKKNINFDNSSDISIYLNNVIKELALIQDPIVRDITLKKLSDETGVLLDTLNNIIKKELKLSKSEFVQSPAIKVDKQFKNKYEHAEQRIVYYMLRSKEVINIYDINNCYLPSQMYRYLANEIVYFYKHYNKIDIADFMVFLGEKKELLEIMGKVLILDLPDEYSSAEIYDYIEVLNQLTIEVEIDRLKQIFKGKTDSLEKAEVVKQIAELRKEGNTSDREY